MRHDKRATVTTLVFALALLVAGFGLARAQGAAASAAPKFDRTVLPIQMPAPPSFNELNVHDVKTPPWVDVTAPAGAPTS